MVLLQSSCIEVMPSVENELKLHGGLYLLALNDLNIFYVFVLFILSQNLLFLTFLSRNN